MMFRILALSLCSAVAVADAPQVGVPPSVWEEARSPVSGADSAASKRLPLPHDTTTDCMGPFYDIPERELAWSTWCPAEIATARAALRKANLPCDALVMEWRDEPWRSSMMKLECFVADGSTYGSSAVAYEAGAVTSPRFKRVSEEQWEHDLMCARGVHLVPGSPGYDEARASCPR
jgi:hypothetical protein